jgi:hypothetical protein
MTTNAKPSPWKTRNPNWYEATKIHLSNGMDAFFDLFAVTLCLSLMASPITVPLLIMMFPHNLQYTIPLGLFGIGLPILGLYCLMSVMDVFNYFDEYYAIMDIRTAYFNILNDGEKNNQDKLEAFVFLSPRRSYGNIHGDFNKLPLPDDNRLIPQKEFMHLKSLRPSFVYTYGYDALKQRVVQNNGQEDPDMTAGNAQAEERRAAEGALKTVATNLVMKATTQALINITNTATSKPESIKTNPQCCG